MTKFLLNAGVACAFALTSTLALAADNQCEAEVKAELAEEGVSWDSLNDVKWDVDEQQASSGYKRVAGYQFYARPSSCKSGRIVVYMDADCRITSVSARGECRAIK